MPFIKYVLNQKNIKMKHSKRPVPDPKKKVFNPELLKNFSSKGIMIQPSLLKLFKGILMLVTMSILSSELSAKDLTSLHLNYTGNKTKLSWQAAPEKNQNYFIIERSENGKTYKAIGMVKASSEPEHFYSFIDKDEYADAAYYRLKIKHSDNGEKDIAHAVALKINPDLKNLIIYEAPDAAMEFYADVSMLNGEKIIIEATDEEGQYLLNKSLNRGEMMAKFRTSPKKGVCIIRAFFHNSIVKCRLTVEEGTLNVAQNIPDKNQLFILK